LTEAKTLLENKINNIENNFNLSIIFIHTNIKNICKLYAVQIKLS